MMTDNIPSWALDAYRHLGAPVSIEAITLGLINKTYLVKTPSCTYVLQEMSPIFDAVVTQDSLAAALHLERAGIKAPVPYMTCDQKLIAHYDDRVFRAIKFIDGTASHFMASPKMATSAGRVVGQFHRAMMDFDHDYHSRRRHGGDYNFHRDNLIATLKRHSDHDFFARVEPLAQEMIAAMNKITPTLMTTPRHVHGDPKVSNILFDDEHEAVCLVDFDTLCQAGWSFEMGDALRSWCNPHGEDVLDAHVNTELAESALTGYGAIMRGVFSEHECGELVTHTQAISLCLAMRFLADVLNENYFRYDASRFDRAASHQWQKARAMFALYQDFARKEAYVTTMINDLMRT